MPAAFPSPYGDTDAENGRVREGPEGGIARCCCSAPESCYGGAKILSCVW